MAKPRSKRISQADIESAIMKVVQAHDEYYQAWLSEVDARVAAHSPENRRRRAVSKKVKGDTPKAVHA